MVYNQIEERLSYLRNKFRNKTGGGYLIIVIFDGLLWGLKIIFSVFLIAILFIYCSLMLIFKRDWDAVYYWEQIG